MMRTDIRISFLLILILTTAGCGGIQPPPLEKTYHELTFTEKLRQAPLNKDGERPYLSIRLLDISKESDTHFFTYRTGENQYTHDYYNEFTTHPSRQVTEILKKELYGTGIFTPFLNPGGKQQQFRLSGKIIRLYGDLRNMDMPVAAMEIHLVMKHHQTGKNTTVLSETYEKEIRLDHFSAENMTDAWDQCLLGITRRFLDDLDIRFH